MGWWPSSSNTTNSAGLSTPATDTASPVRLPALLSVWLTVTPFSVLRAVRVDGLLA
jgi:hypothetical protein